MVALTLMKQCGLAIVCFVVLWCAPLTAHSDGISWREWKDAQFQEANSQDKLILLNLEATWCHWCHVMEQQTYANAAVQKLLEDHYLAVKVDQDSRPDLALRYSDWGWPATIIFNAKGQELAKRAGFVEPAEMLALLQQLSENPTAEISQADISLGGSQGSTLTKDLETKLLDKHYASFDAEKGGLKIAQKFLDADSVEYSLRRSRRSNGERDQLMARLTLDNNMKLIDPVWGGVYQYSTYRDWNNPHFEKIMSTQAKNMRIYAFAYSVFGDNRYKAAGHDIYRYVTSFLRDQETGSFYVSQDADVLPGEHSSDYFKKSDSARRKEGIPRVDTNHYSRENGWIIEALASLYAVTGKQSVLESAVTAARWTLANRSIEGGGFSHSERDAAGPFLGDTLAMGRACLALYSVTAERHWLTCANDAGVFISKHFVVSLKNSRLPGVVSSVSQSDSPIGPVRDLDENISAARFANLLYHYTGREEFQKLASTIMRYIVLPEVVLRHVTDAGVLLAAEELASDPLHITVVCKKGDPQGAKLFAAAIRYPDTYKRIEWYDRTEGLLQNNDVTYPEIPKPAAFVCSNRRCSLPVFNVNGLDGVIKRFSQGN